MTLLTAIMVGVTFAVAVYLLTGRDLKSLAVGMFLLAHGANLALMAASRSPVGKLPPVLGEVDDYTRYADPLPQALILTAIVIGFAVQAFLLTLLVVTWRRTSTVELSDLAEQTEEPESEETREAERPVRATT